MARNVWQAMKGVQFIAIAYLISLISLGYAYNANTTAVREANNRAILFKAEADARAAAIEAQNARFRYAFCSFQPYAEVTTPPPSESAKILREGMQKIISPKGLDCSPDPNDGN